jgi:ubiquinone/menaquinone biosynthesis C-methylase UbiE
MISQNQPPDYSSVEYWNQRYSQEVGLSFDWIRTYEEIKEFIIPCLFGNKQAEILVIGCGNSLLSEGIYHEGYRYISNIDFSEEIIHQMEDRYKEYSDMDFQVADATDLKLEPNCMSCVIDKGVLDSIMCGVSGQEEATKMISNIYNVLTPGGVYICVSCAPPENRELIFAKPGCNWEIKKHKLPIKGAKDPLKYHYIYILSKKIDDDI